MSTWKGVSHARMTRSMSALRGGEYKVLAAVRRLIPDGARRKISQAEIAARAGVSEGTVSAAMRRLDGAYLTRHLLGRGRGAGYEIELLPPPEQAAAAGLSTPPKGSNSDPCNRSFSDGVPTPQAPPEKGSDSDPSLFLDHAHEQQQQPGAQPQADNQEEAPALAAETIAALQAANAHPKLIQRVAEHNPGCTPADVARALAAAGVKPNAHTPPGLALEALARRQEVVPPRPLEARPADEPRRPRGGRAPAGEVVDPAAARAWLEEQGLPVTPPPDAPAAPAAPREPHRPPAPYLGPPPPPERVVVPGAPPPVARAPIERPPPGQRRLGVIAERARELQRAKLRGGGR